MPAGIATLMLAIAILPIDDYGYYILLRWIIFLTAVLFIYLFHGNARAGWAWIFVLVALVFNPAIPFHLNKKTWVIIDGISALLFGAVFLSFLTRKRV